MADKKKGIVVLSTMQGENLILWEDPPVKTVRSFVKEHNRRFYENEACGPSGEDAFLILSATRYPSYDVFSVTTEQGKNVNIRGLTSKTSFIN